MAVRWPVYFAAALLTVLLLISLSVPLPPVVFGVAFVGFWNWLKRER